MKRILLGAFLLAASAGITLGQTANVEIKASSPPCYLSPISQHSSFSNPNKATADLFSKNGGKDAGIPTNYMGTQDSPGDSYIGIITYYGDYARRNKKGKWISHGFDAWSEYAYTALPATLSAGQEYSVSFKVSLADYSKFATSGLGALFTSGPIATSNTARLTQEPQVSSSQMVKDKNGWTEISGTFTAKGDEKYIAIGAFDKNYGVEYVGEPYDNGSPRAYYYVTGIHVEPSGPKDSDGDGVADKDDACPDVKGIASLNGCPDSDGDGIADKDDACPDAKGPKATMGCPDRDGDGIADKDDKCPDVRGTVANGGCPPEIKAEVKKILEQALTGLQFEPGKDVIKKTSYHVMDNVVQVMKDNPSYNLSISGHTDNTGDHKMNQALSEKRAAAAAKYLSDRGIASSRLTTAGYGDTVPVADNKTAEGRAKNRRVEFKVTF